MPGSRDEGLCIKLADEPVVLLGDRAMFWPARSRLIIADLHLGKSHVFRQAGIAVPQGATRDDLMRLDQLLESTAAAGLWIVGDMLHGPMDRAGWRDTWTQWRKRHATLDVAALTGNHDRALDGAVLDIRQLGESATDGPFLFRHLPCADPHGRHVIAGHVHPKTRVPGVPRSWPAFWLRESMTVLPAFSDFTGGQVVGAGDGSALVACVEGSALAIGFAS
ncbi:ligase-associated DNA damage response endonuclease PdeM [Achromobacter sp. UMC46]|uniref:ligase-associated DNA damage response endonuclease PdeM n=1 Tax=Achromobacter sp. UMC46 TaxID=1862319 RepID=UPI0015FEB8FA|nr:ligase-associated DNA damage response endonuclease PdeM [Achromobacter sp. UMC46]MBB1595140.1 phosphoesterase [Achromobacter sp. UMC46]